MSDQAHIAFLLVFAVSLNLRNATPFLQQQLFSFPSTWIVAVHIFFCPVSMVSRNNVL